MKKVILMILIILNCFAEDSRDEAVYYDSQGEYETSFDIWHSLLTKYEKYVIIIKNMPVVKLNHLLIT